MRAETHRELCNRLGSGHVQEHIPASIKKDFMLQAFLNGVQPLQVQPELWIMYEYGHSTHGNASTSKPPRQYEQCVPQPQHSSPGLQAGRWWQ